MTDQQIDRLIAARNNITDRIESDEVDQHTAEIDALLRDVPPGTRNDVDRLLGRTCAVLPKRADYGLETDLELTRRIWRETPADEKGY